MEEELELHDRDLFERLWILRQVYAYRSRYDSEPVLPIDAAITYAELSLRLSRAHRFWSSQVT